MKVFLFNREYTKLRKGLVDKIKKEAYLFAR